MNPAEQRICPDCSSDYILPFGADASVGPFPENFGSWDGSLFQISETPQWGTPPLFHRR